jgi:hypothetical protein
MDNLFVFGCSFTEDYNNSKAYEEYKKYRGGVLPKNWATILGEKLNMNVFNYGKGGSGNLHIFMKFCSLCDKINEGDIVIIGWSKSTRFRWVQGNDWVHLNGSDRDLPSITMKTCNEIIVNRSSDLYIKEVYDYENIIKELSKYKKFKVFFWSSDNNIIYKSNKTEECYLLIDYNNNNIDFTPFNLIFKDDGALTIRNETNGKIEDDHLSEKGHIKQSDLFYQHIIKNI